MKTDIQIERWPLDRLVPFARNPRTHTEEQVAQIAASIAEFGWTNPVLVGADGVIIAGHARVMAARKLGLSEVPVIVLDHLSEAQRRALVIADNQLALAGTGWDEDLLRGLLVDLRQDEFNLDVLGFSDEELAGWLTQDPEAPQEGLTEEDAVPEPLEEPVTRRGDLWILGNHRLLCGDSASSEDVKRLVEGAPVDLVNTDPPYNVRVEPRSNNAIAAGLSSFVGLQHHQSFDVHRGASKAKATTKKMRPKDRALANDFMKDGDYDVLLRKWFGNLAEALKPGGSFYIWGGYANCANYPPALAECGLYFSQAIIWVKEHPVLTRKDFMGNHEWSFYGWREGAAHWFNPEITNATDVWSVKKVSPNAMVHLTEKPVELAARALTYSSKAGQTVLDLFGGSGSTLIACEKLGRRARLMEIDPPYCDVICRRFMEFSGKPAKLEATGQTFDEVRDARLSTASVSNG
ncbi:MAG TPA: site-specific DNA-methyltransferase [Bryobacteraceae bacterium]|nr:site-specific DNA-methyltransferase [Bryobacteraceae bacterium]